MTSAVMTGCLTLFSTKCTGVLREIGNQTKHGWPGTPLLHTRSTCFLLAFLCVFERVFSGVPKNICIFQIRLLEAKIWPFKVLHHYLKGATHHIKDVCQWLLSISTAHHVTHSGPIKLLGLLCDGKMIVWILILVHVWHTSLIGYSLLGINPVSPII